MAQNDTSALREHLESLPQELYDIIFDYTFTPTIRNGVVTVEDNFNGAAISSVSRATNALLAKRYSGCTIVGNVLHVLAFLKCFMGREKVSGIRCWMYEGFGECLKSQKTFQEDSATMITLRKRLESYLGRREMAQFELMKEWALDDEKSPYSFP